MKILALRGENLASLARPFAIDFTASPLSGAGLFAIVGDTGAGKSTLLDALCLALYGGYPRLEIAGSETATDANGDPIKASDQRNVLRRGAGRAFAEVDFEANDGHVYRARWEIRRAREKADGKLQAGTPSLIRLHDDTTLATKTREVESLVTQLTGLTFDQFRRTCLLAQGQFDAFLTAAENQRAELLERITGTGIYSRISEIVYQQTGIRQQAVDTLKLQLSQFQLLSPEERAAIQDAIRTLEQTAAANQTALSRLQSEAAAWTALATATAKLAAAEKAESESAASIAAREADRTLLANLDKADPLRSALTALGQAELAHRKATADATQAATAATTQAQALEAAQAAHTKAAEAKVTSDQAVEALTPQWQAAQDLDAKLAHARAELETAQQILRQKRDRARETADEQTKQYTAYSVIQGKLHNLQTWLDANAAQSHAAAQIAHVTGLADARQGLLSTSKAHAAALPKLHKKRTDLDNRLATHRREIQDTSTQLTTLSAAIETSQHRIDAVPHTALTTERRDTQNLLERLTEAGQLIQSILDLRLQQSTHLDAAKSTREQAVHLHATVADLDRQLLAAQAASAEANAASDRANLTASKAAEHLRAHLENGQPCPVCGSERHPILDLHANLARDAAAAKTRRDELTRQVDGFLMQRTATQGQLATAESKTGHAQTLARDAAGKLAIGEANYASLVPNLPADIPATPDAVTVDAIRARRDQCSTRLAEIDNDLNDHATAKDGHARLLKEQVNLEQKRNDRNQAIQQEQTESTDLIGEIAQTEAAIASLSEQLAANATSLNPLLSPFNLTVAQLDAKFDHARATLINGAAHFKAQRDALETTRADLAQAETTLAVAQTNASAAESAANEATTDTAAKEQSANALATQRAQLLNGEALQSHRQRHLNAQSDAHKSHLNASQNLSRAEAASQAAADLATRAAHDETLSAEAHIRAAAEFDAASSNLGFPPATARDLLAVPPASRQALQQELAALDRDHHAARQLHAAAAQAHLAAEQACRQLPALPEIASARTAAEQSRTEALSQIGAHRHALHEDRNRQANAAEVEARLAEANQTYQTWHEVNAAIGSAKGDKFRKFVQSLTLDHLIHLANHHLATFAPRYRLSRAAAGELSLQIVDRDMADTLRPVSTLSGGERFLTSLGLALALSGLEGKAAFVDTLFIDEGFGSLDAGSLQEVMAALETLPGSGRRVGVITHVEAMRDRIAVQVRVTRQGNGRSTVSIVDAASAEPLLTAHA